jgi:hypothetical protein
MVLKGVCSQQRMKKRKRGACVELAARWLEETLNFTHVMFECFIIFMDKSPPS